MITGSRHHVDAAMVTCNVPKTGKKLFFKILFINRSIYLFISMYEKITRVRKNKM